MFYLKDLHKNDKLFNCLQDVAYQCRFGECIMKGHGYELLPPPGYKRRPPQCKTYKDCKCRLNLNFFLLFHRIEYITLLISQNYVLLVL